MIEPLKCLVFIHNKPQVTHNVAFQSHVKNNTKHTLSVYELTSVLEASSTRIGRLPAEGFREASVRLFDEDWGIMFLLIMFCWHIQRFWDLLTPTPTQDNIYSQTLHCPFDHSMKTYIMWSPCDCRTIQALDLFNVKWTWSCCYVPWCLFVILVSQWITARLRTLVCPR